MKTKFPRLSFTKSNKAGRALSPADTEPNVSQVRPPPLSKLACCCPARPVVVAVIPVTAQRLRPADIQLCAHHYRLSRITLTVAGAVVFDGTGAVVTDTDPFELLETVP